MSSTPPAQVVQDDHSAAETNHPPANTSNQILNNQLLAEYQGDCIDEKRNNTFRIGLININGLPKSSKHPKNKNIEEFLLNYKFDFISLVETNCFWPAVEEDDTWQNRLKEWNIKKSKSVPSYLKEPTVPIPNQPGGTMSMAIETTASKVIDSGKDINMGRWSWITLQGKNGICTTIISGYQPCRNTSTPNTVFLQQQRYLAAVQVKKCPLQLWLEDMGTFVKSKLRSGHQVILAADINDPVKGSISQNWSKSVGLREVVSKTTPIDIPTYQRGTRAIDGIFMSHSLQPVQAGYLPLGEIQSDHRGLWVDLPHSQVYGFSPPNSLNVQPRRLQCNIPEVRKRWIKLYTSFLQQHNLVARQFKFEAQVNGYLTVAQQKEFEKILQLRTEGINHAEKRCRKLRVGGVPHSPTMQQAMLEIELWKAAHTLKTGCKYSSRKFRRLEKKTGISNSLSQSISAIRQEEKISFTKYWATKKDARALRKTFLNK